MGNVKELAAREIPFKEKEKKIREDGDDALALTL